MGLMDSFGSFGSGIGGIGSAIGAIGGLIGGGSGGMSGLQKQQMRQDMAWNNSLRDRENALMDRAQRIASKRENWDPYSGNRVADFSPDQTAAFGMMRDATSASNPYYSAAGNQALATLNGDYMGHTAGENAYLGATNPYAQATNPMLGMNNPYLENAINQAGANISRQFNQTTAPQTDSSFARAGAFGGSAWQNANAQNQYQLAQSLGNVNNSMRMQDYQSQQQLQENNLNRLSGLASNDLSRNAALAQTGIGLNEAAYQNERARQYGGIGQGLQMQDQGIQNASALQGSGSIQQQQSQNQIQAMMDYYQQKQAAARAPTDWQSAQIQGFGTASPVSPAASYSAPNSLASRLGGAIGGAQLGSGLMAALGGLFSSGNSSSSPAANYTGAGSLNYQGSSPSIYGNSPLWWQN